MNTVSINEPIKLLTQVQDFSFFAEDQVLTAGQLNRLVQHLDFQDRATRVWLVGTGIVCGLTHERQGTTVVLQPGCAITSDGDLLTLSDPKTLTHFRPFKDEDAAYQPLKEHAPLTELVSSDVAEEDDTAKQLTAGRLNNSVLALYLESFAEPPEFCTGDNCDNKGPIQHNNIRVILLPKGEVTPLPAELPEVAEALPAIRAARPKLSTGIKKLEGNNGLQAAFTTAIGNTRKALVDSLQQTRTNGEFKSALDNGGFNAPPNWNTALPGRTLNPASEINGLLNVFGFFRDFAEAYEEWRQSLYCLRGYCHPDPSAFPKHVLLGQTGVSSPCPRDLFRHPFYRASTAGPCGQELQRARLLWQRLIGMASRFDQTPSTQNVRMTPSADCHAPLGSRALPAYYGGRLNAPWNVDNRLRCAPDEPLSYHTVQAGDFLTDLCRMPFYRIEGHLGRPLDEVESQLKKLRTDHNLAFQILAIQIEDDPDRVVLRPHRFFDIETLFHHHRLDLKLRLNDVDGFADRIKSAITDGRDRIPADQKPDDAIEASGALKTSARTAKSRLPMRIADFNDNNVTSFVSSYSTAISHGHQLNTSTYSLAQNMQFTPGDRFVQPELPTRFGQLLDIFNKRRRKVAELSVFQKFVQQNPGLEHLGGVPKGGTFVLVYSASDNESGRIVKADFCLPYYSYFDMSAIEEEEPPVEPEAPQKPPYVFEPRPWVLDYDWKVMPLTEVVLDHRFTQFDKDFSATLNTRVNQTVTDQFKVFADLGGIYSGQKGNITGEFGGNVILPGAEDLRRDAEYGAFIEEINRNQSDIERMREAKRKGIAPSDVDKQIQEKEMHNAELIGKANEKLVENVAKAESTGGQVGARERAMANALKGSSMMLESNEAKKTVKESFKQINESNAGSTFIRTNFGKIHNAF